MKKKDTTKTFSNTTIDNISRELHHGSVPDTPFQGPGYSILWNYILPHIEVQ
ncbi:MAG: hypothetical protein NTX36_15580 [Proteobacteria bacterium]|nr:hypothetical protein [Pseudomonadota bacterium]